MDRITTLFSTALRRLGITNDTDNNDDLSRQTTPPPPQPGARPQPTATSFAPRLSLGFTPRPASAEDHVPTTTNPSRLSSQSQQRLTPLDVNTVVKIALILSRKLPRDVVPLILDFAELWPIAAATRRDQDIRITQHQAGRIVAALVLPHYIAPNSVRRIRFITNSKDQGWSNYNENRGSYDNSWTWFEAGVCRKEKSERVPPLTVDLHVNPADPGDGVFAKTCDPTDYDHKSRRIVTNVHAGWSYKEHEVVWDADHEDEEVRQIVRRAKAGQRIEVSAWAMYPGWTNQVKQVTIEVECQFVRKM